jgi:phenylacetic acid degradation operon negative regulatory protein
VWIRPDNLVQPVDGVVAEQCTFFRCQYDDPHEMTAKLWDLSEWAGTALELYEDMEALTSLKAGFMVIAEAVRHLRIDPYLPEELLPADWPGPELRKRYIGFRDDFAQRLRDYSTR